MVRLGNGAFTCDSFVTGDHPDFAKSADGSVWRHTGNDHWLQIDLGAGNGQPVSKVKLRTISNGAYMPSAYFIQCRDSTSASWTNVVSTSGAANSEERVEVFDSVGPQRFWRLYVTNCDGDVRIDMFALYKNKHI